MSHREMSASRGLALLLVVLCACSEPAERTPATCEGCGINTGGGVGVGSGGSAGTGGGQAGLGANAGAGVKLEGDLLVLTDFDFRRGLALTDPGTTVRAEGQAGGFVITDHDGIGPYVLEDVLSADEVWALAVPSPGSVALPTLGPVDTSQPDQTGTVNLDLALVGTDLIDVILNLLTVPTARDPERASAVLRVTTATGAPIAGVTVIEPSAEVVVYGASGTFSDVVTATDASGLVMLVNLPASSSWICRSSASGSASLRPSR
jgi:hypothetical protein